MKQRTAPAPLSILYRDECMIAVDKPAGQLVIPSTKPQADDEVTMKILRDQIGVHVHPIHRLDRPTSGVLLFSSSQDAARALHAAFANQEVRKLYWAVVSGRPVWQEWTCRESLTKDEAADAQSAETKFRVIEHLDHDLSLLEAEPKSGRFHQIRRHLVHLGHPIVGDYRYAGIERSDQLGALLGTGTRMLLQSISLQLRHPATGDELLIEAPVEALIQGLRHYFPSPSFGIMCLLFADR
jgi:tRNA pseudouridine65 synthase